MQTLDKILNIDYPVILAPMFLVSSPLMIKTALDNGITAAIPAMNFRKQSEFAAAIKDIKSHSKQSFGINIIANKSNTQFTKQLSTILENPPAFIISSLGNPKELILEAHKLGIKVFCDVVDLKYAKKVEDLGADALIAVNSSAGGHAGVFPVEKIVPELLRNCNIPIISAGGVSSCEDYKKVLNLGAAGVSIGTIFIASQECPVSEEYKNALIKYGKNDIVLTRKLSGAPTTVINTEYVKKFGTQANFLEYLVNKNTFLKKTAKSLITKMGMKKLEKAAFGTSYQTVWCAGPSIESIKSIRSISEIIASIVCK
jgi:nitronate monooxygenase